MKGNFGPPSGELFHVLSKATFKPSPINTAPVARLSHGPVVCARRCSRLPLPDRKPTLIEGAHKTGAQCKLTKL